MAKILIVDDTKFMRVTLSAILEDDNHEIVGEAENGAEAIELFKQMKPDLVTMDITMPVMDGIDSIKGIMEIDSSAKIIVCSSMRQQRIVIKAIELGATDFIVKPFNHDFVLKTVNQVLGSTHG